MSLPSPGARRVRVAAPVVAVVAIALLVAVLAQDAPTRNPRVPAVSPASTPPAAPGSTSDRPDVLVVLTDDQRTDTVALMPQVQRLLAEKGTSFARA